MKGVKPSDGDFLKYIPDVLLNEEQKAGKGEGSKRESDPSPGEGRKRRRFADRTAMRRRNTASAG